MSIGQLFSTPEQGRRLKELVPTIEPTMWWVDLGGDFEDHPYFKDQYVYEYGIRHAPALTLQELRTEFLIWFWNGNGDKDMFSTFKDMMLLNTAPELAAWVIERLEEVEP